jgi:hypothetical protein
MDKYKIMKDHLKRYQNSGMRIREYCDEYELSEDSFHYWKSKFARESKQNSNKSLVPIEIDANEDQFKLNSKSILIKIDPDGSVSIKVGSYK